MECPHCNKATLKTEYKIQKHPEKKGRVKLTIYTCNNCGFWGSQREDKQSPRKKK